MRGNHNGGVLAFGPDGKLYVTVGDLGRRGALQNLPNGPTGNGPDDQFGGPVPTTCICPASFFASTTMGVRRPTIRSSMPERIATAPAEAMARLLDEGANYSDPWRACC